MYLKHILNIDEQQLKLADQMQPEQTYNLQNVIIEIMSTEHQLTYPNCTLQIDQNCVAIVFPTQGQEQKVINILFSNISSVGIQDNNIMVFLEGQQEQNEQINQDQDGNIIAPQMPEIMSLIDKSQMGTFNLQGNFTLSLGLAQHSEQKRKQVHQLMVGYLKSEEDDQEGDNFMQEMISADQINEDGTINKFNSPDDNDSSQSAQSDSQHSIDEQR